MCQRAAPVSCQLFPHFYHHYDLPAFPSLIQMNVVSLISLPTFIAMKSILLSSSKNSIGLLGEMDQMGILFNKMDSRGMGLQWSGNGPAMVWEWACNGLGMGLQWSGNGPTMVREWAYNGPGMAYNGLGMGLQWSGNGLQWSGNGPAMVWEWPTMVWEWACNGLGMGLQMVWEWAYNGVGMGQDGLGMGLQ